MTNHTELPHPAQARPALRVKTMPAGEGRVSFQRYAITETEMTTYAYQIDPRPAERGGGWRLRLLEDDEEVGGGVFPADETSSEAAYCDALNEAADWIETRQPRP